MAMLYLTITQLFLWLHTELIIEVTSCWIDLPMICLFDSKASRSFNLTLTALIVF